MGPYINTEQKVEVAYIKWNNMNKTSKCRFDNNDVIVYSELSIVTIPSFTNFRFGKNNYVIIYRIVCYQGSHEQRHQWGLYGFRCSWWRHQMETFSALLALCEGKPPVTAGFPSQRHVTRIFDEQTDDETIETPWRSWWRHCNMLAWRLAIARTSATLPFISANEKVRGLFRNIDIYKFSPE